MCRQLIYVNVRCVCVLPDCPHRNLPSNSSDGREHRRTHSYRTEWEFCRAWRAMEFQARHDDPGTVNQVCWDNEEQTLEQFGEAAPACPETYPTRENAYNWHCGTCELHRQYYATHMSGRF